MSNQVFPWVAFNIFVLAMLAIDLRVFHRQAHTVTVREALAWSAVWVALALLFVVAGILAIAVIASIVRPPQAPRTPGRIDRAADEAAADHLLRETDAP
jgi:hypothetical protein